jgi:hypothetical protein
MIELVVAIGVWAIVVLLALMAYIVGRRDWIHHRAMAASLESWGAANRAGVEALTASMRQLEERVRRLEERVRHPEERR